MTPPAIPRPTGIIFSTPMVQAILAGTKTMTRRVIVPQPWTTFPRLPETEVVGMLQHAPYRVGQTFYIKETWGIHQEFDAVYDQDKQPLGYGLLFHRADIVGEAHPPVKRWRSARFMPRWAARLFLEITAVRVERVQDITERDAVDEGIVSTLCQAPAPTHFVKRFIAPGVVHTNSYGDKDDHAPAYPTAKSAFECLWDSINSKRGYGWDLNPWVWVVTFCLLHSRHL